MIKYIDRNLAFEKKKIILKKTFSIFILYASFLVNNLSHFRLKIKIKNE